MNCNVCRTLLEPNSFLHCRLCKYDYHYKCLNIKSSQFAALSEEFLLSWVCPACTNVTRRNKSNCNTPVRQQPSSDPEQSLNMSCEDQDPNTTKSFQSQTDLQLSHPSRSSDPSVTMEKISQMMDEKLNVTFSYYMASFRAALNSDIEKMVKNQVKEVIKELKNDFTVTTDFLSSEQKDLQAKIDSQNAIIRDLEKENCDIKRQLSQVESKVCSMDNLSRSLNIEIQAVPENKNENVGILFQKLCEVIGVKIDDSSVRACRRVAKMNNGSSRPRNILVTLASPRQRDLIISSVHRFNKKHSDAMLNSSHLGLPSTSACRIYVAEHLSPELKMLHAETRKIAVSNNFKYVWVRYGKIYVRKDDSSSAINIKNQDSLKKLCQK